MLSGRLYKSVTFLAGKILLTISLHGKFQESPSNGFHDAHSKFNSGGSRNCTCHTKLKCRKIPEGKHLVKCVRKLFHKNEEAARMSDEAPSSNPLEFSGVISEYEDCVEENSSNCSYQEALEIMQSKGNEEEMPENLRGGVLIDQAYAVSPSDLNTFLFAPNSQFRKDLAELQGATDLQEGPWTFNAVDKPCLTRVVTYKNAATKLVKSVKATEEQTYVKAYGREFAVYVTVSTPEVPYGNTFKVELLYKMIPGPERPSGEESSRLILSWAINFHHSTMMKGMIEGGAAQGLKESFNQFSDLLAQNLKVLNSTDLSNKEQILATLQTEHQSDWEMAVEYFWNFTVVTTVLMVVYVLVHMLLCEPREHEGLEFNGLDLPDSFEEFITCAIFVIQLKNVYNMVMHFIQARLLGGEYFVLD